MVDLGSLWQRGKKKFIPKEPKAFVPGPRCEECDYLTKDRLWCLKKKKDPEKCNVPLLFTAVCPKCGRTTQGKREWGEVRISFECKGSLHGHPCGCRYELTFHGHVDDPVEISKRQWEAGQGNEWTDFTLRPRRRQ